MKNSAEKMKKMKQTARSMDQRRGIDGSTGYQLDGMCCITSISARSNITFPRYRTVKKLSPPRMMPSLLPLNNDWRNLKNLIMLPTRRI